MKRNKLFSVYAALTIIALPAAAVFSGMDLDATLTNLRRELYHEYRQISRTQDQLQARYETQHQRMVDIVKKCNDLSLMLYSQKQDYTFDIAYALEKVTKEYYAFNKNRTPYDRVVTGLDIEIGRYARLIESLRRLPPELKYIEVVPDSLAYHNDTLDAHLSQNESLLQQELNVMLDSLLTQTIQQDSILQRASNSAFILSEAGQADRDSCMFYASELLKMYAQTRELVMTDSTHYREAHLRIKESYDYARDYYKILQKSVFLEGQTPYPQILLHPAESWRQVRIATSEKFGAADLAQEYDLTAELEENATNVNNVNDDSRVNNLLTLIWLPIYILSFLLLWGLAALLMLPVYRFVKPAGKAVAKEQRRYVALLLGCILFIILSTESVQDDRAIKALRLAHTFIWLLMAITAALLLRLKPDKLKQGLRNYLPTIITALFVISCRVLFLPNALMNFLFPPLLLAMTLWQLIANLRRTGKSDRTDVLIGWTSFAITAIATACSWAGYIFLALIILVWWYFQLAFVLFIAAVWSLLSWYKTHRLNKKVAKFKEKITFVSGPAQESLLFGATWFHDLIRDVVLPLLALVSIPACIHWALDVFEFNDLYRQIFAEPFVQQGGPEGFRVSLYAILFLTGLFFVFRYLDKAVHTIWQSLQYERFFRKNNRRTIRNNEINLSLGNSLITVSVWFIYIYIFIVTLQIPTGSLGLIAGGLSAGVGLALKDIINNFIYGIQLMGGRLRVGDWIECDGVRGKVTDINYQTTLVETTDATQVAFLNSSLFGKNFTNLTRNNSYEFTKVTVGVAYGTDFERVRELLEKGLEPLKTKDAYGRDVVDPTHGIYIRFGNFADSAVEVAVKQYVLVPERIGYVDRCKELVYKILNEGGITIPFPQCDVHMIKDDDKD
ncbi:MAG: mechanosensitive ion channel [Bacteroidales bacterium]|nr:mechanosensitive ion channel [Bacteroidales bacterium]